MANDEWSDFETVETIPDVRGRAYGPVVGEYHRDAMFGPNNNELGEKDIALSPDHLKRFPIGSKVLANGKGPYTVADVSYIKPGHPNKNTVEFRDTATPPASITLSPAPDEWSGFEDVKATAKEQPQPKVSRQPTEKEAETAPRATGVHPWQENAFNAMKKGDYSKAFEYLETAVSQGIRRAVSAPTTGDITFKDVEESAVQGFEPTKQFPELRPSREQVEKSLQVPGVVDLSKIPYVTDISQATAEMPADVAEFFTSPGGVASMGLGALPKIVQALVGAGFTAQQVQGAIQSKDNVNKIKNMLFGALGAAGTFQILKGGEKPYAKTIRSDAEQVREGGQEGQRAVQAGPIEGGGDIQRQTQEQAGGAETPKLRPGEKGTAELFQREDQPFNLAGETGTDFEAQQKKAEAKTKAAEEARAAAEKAQTLIPFDEWSDFEMPSPEEQARIQSDYESGLMVDAEEHQGRGGDELLTVLKQHGMPALSSKYSERYAGELDAIRGLFAKKGGLARNPTGEAKYSDVFRNDALGDLDALTQHLRSKGFDVEDINDTLAMIHKRLFEGRKVFGSEARAEAMWGDLPDSAFPQVGAIAGQPSLIPVDWLWKFGQRLNEYRKGFQALIRARPTRDIVAATFDRINNDAAIAGDHAGNEARIQVGARKRDFRARTALPGKQEPAPTMDEQAIIPVIEAWAGHEGAAGTPLFPVTMAQARAKLIRDVQKVINSSRSSPELKRVYKYALDNFDRLAAKKPSIDAIHYRQLKSERAHGIDTDDVNGYVAHRFDMDLFNFGKPIILDSTGGRGGSSAYFMKQRVFPDYATAISSGYVPKKFDIASLVNNRVRAGQNKINQRQWLNALRKEHDPISNKPLVTDMIKQPKGTEVAPAGYVPMEPFTGQRVAVNEYFAPLIRALTGESHFPKAMSKLEAGIKHGILLFDSFHLSRLMQMQTALMGKVSYRKGLSLAEYSDRMLDEGVKRNEITQPMADYARKNRSDFNGLVGHGLNVGQISDALFRDVVSNIPVAGNYTDWLFSKFNRGIITESGQYMLDRNRRLYPNMSESELFRKSAKETNTYFRNLRSQGIFKRKTWQDAMRFFTLAPQWYEGMIKSELTGYGQLLKAPYDAVTKQKFVAGNIAKGMGSGLLTYMVGAQLINMLSRGHPTWENPEEGEKWSAWVPDFLGDSNGFFLNPMGVFAEMTHDIMKYSKLYPNKIDLASKIIQNKFSPISRALRDVFIGKDFFGRPLESVSERVMQAGIDLLPIPIGARSVSQQYAGSQERTLSSSLGFKLDVAPSAARQISLQAKDWNREHGLKVHDAYPSEYGDLRNALKEGDMEQAQKQYDKLKKTKSKAVIRRYFDRMAKTTFTGSKARESQFRRHLPREQQDIYNQAVEEAKRLRQRFYQLSK